MHARALLGLTCGRGVSRALNCCLAPAGLAVGLATPAESGAFSPCAGTSRLGVKRGLRVPVLRRGGAGWSARTRRGARGDRARKVRLQGLAQLRWSRRPVSGEAT